MVDSAFGSAPYPASDWLEPDDKVAVLWPSRLKIHRPSFCDERRQRTICWTVPWRSRLYCTWNRLSLFPSFITMSFIIFTSTKHLKNFVTFYRSLMILVSMSSLLHKRSHVDKFQFHVAQSSKFVFWPTDWYDWFTIRILIDSLCFMWRIISGLFTDNMKVKMLFVFAL